MVINDEKLYGNLSYEYPYFLDVAEWRLKICRKCPYKKPPICPNNSCLHHDIDDNLNPRRENQK